MKATFGIIFREKGVIFMLKQYKSSIVSFYIIAVCALIAASFLDLRIDIMLNNPEDPFSKWFECMGEMPSRLICPVAGTVLFYLCEKPIAKATGVIVNLLGSAYLGYHIAHYFFLDNKNNIPFGILFGVGIGLTFLFIGQYITVSENRKRMLIFLSVAGIIIMFLQLGLVEIGKIFWGRVRFRDLITEPDYASFTAWYHPNGANGNRSFPSGHTAGAAMSFLAMYLPYLSDQCGQKKLLCYILPLIYTAVVAYTRLVMGAHYLSDVTAGAVIGFTLVIIGMNFADKKYLSCNLVSNNV